MVNRTNLSPSLRCFPSSNLEDVFASIDSPARNFPRSKGIESSLHALDAAPEWPETKPTETKPTTLFHSPLHRTRDERGGGGQKVERTEDSEEQAASSKAAGSCQGSVEE